MCSARLGAPRSCAVVLMLVGFVRLVRLAISILPGGPIVQEPVGIGDFILGTVYTNRHFPKRNGGLAGT